MNPSKATPMIRQYLEIKQEYPDALLFYRMGDFFEMFFEDAQTASKILEIALTSRNKKEARPVPMCGVPARAVKGYITRLIEHGYKVAICDQVEDPAKAKGLVKREVVRVITPGMILDDEYLDEKSNNYILALCREQSRAGLSYLDISTGTFRVSESADLQIIVDEALRASPSELLLPEYIRDDAQDPLFSKIKAVFAETHITYLEADAFDPRQGKRRLAAQFNTLSLEGFGCQDLNAGLGAAGALLCYVRETQKQAMEHVTGIESYRLDTFLWLDDTSCRNLELMQNIRTGSRTGTLLGVMDKTVTAMGGRLFKRWLRYPLLDLDEIEARLDAVAEAKENLSGRRDIRELLESVYDLERLGAKMAMQQAGARDLVALKRSLQTIPKIWSALSPFDAAQLQPPPNPQPLHDLAQLIEAAIRPDAPPTLHEGGIIKEGYNSELDDLIRISQDGKGWLAKLEASEKAASGISSLKVGYNRIFGYYIEVSKLQSRSVPDYFVRKQTLVNAERYITDELKQYEQKVFGAEEKRAVLEYDLFNNIRQAVLSEQAAIREAGDFLAALDCLFTLAEIADQNNYERPQLNTQGQILIIDGRHPVIEKMITAERFVPNTVCLDNDENQVLVITGPNMAGKSTILRQVALTVLMAQIGSFVPAKSASIHAVDRIFTRVGALDNLSQGQSTFLVEMEETANILHNATDQSLVIMDEIGRGTSTFDGLSIAWAVVEYLHDVKGHGAKTLFATHYHELTELADIKPRIKNYNIAVKEWNDEIIFLRKLVQGGTNRSYGIQVARLAGIPDDVVRHAKKILFRIENGRSGKPDALASTSRASVQREVQRTLFERPEQWVMDKLKRTDISKMTPLDAMNCLNELKKKAAEATLA